MEEVSKHSVHTLVFRSLKRSHDMFISDNTQPPPQDETSVRIKLACKTRDEYGMVKDMVIPRNATGQLQQNNRSTADNTPNSLSLRFAKQDTGKLHLLSLWFTIAIRRRPKRTLAELSIKNKGLNIYSNYKQTRYSYSPLEKFTQSVTELDMPTQVVLNYAYPHAPGVQLSAETAAPQQGLSPEDIDGVLRGLPLSQQAIDRRKTAAGVIDIQRHAGLEERVGPMSNALVAVSGGTKGSHALIPRKAPTMPKPEWHAPWKLYRVISGHLGWVRSLAVEPGNQWFVSGSNDRIIKIWDLASGKLKLSLTGHISAVRGIAVSKRQPYLFSCGEDKQVKCWDLEQNKVIRHYHGHLSACYALDLHPTLDILASCGRDSTVRIWDMRTKACIHTLSGHTNTVATVKCQAAEPQIVSGSHDSTVRLWDLAAGKSRATLTNHKKSVRALVLHPKLYMMASASPDNIKEWKFPDGNFMQNLTGHQAIINCLAVNSDGVLVSGGDNGTLHLWDWRTGYNFQRSQAPTQSGSLDSEAGVFAMTFDNSGSRLITAEADKTIKIYKEDEEATEETNPINWKPEILKKKKY